MVSALRLIGADFFSRYFFLSVTIVICTLYFLPVANAATYTLTSGTYPPCNTSWSVSGTTYTCTGDGRVTLASGDILRSSVNITIVAANGFALNNSTVGTSTANINLTSSYGTITSSGANTIYGSLTGGSSVITLANTNVVGAITTGGNIVLTDGSVSGRVTSSSNTITTTNTDLSGGATAQSGMTITGGIIAGSFTMTAYNQVTLSGVTMTSGSISGASMVNIQNGSVLGSSTSAITINSSSGPITLDNSTVYGNLTAPNYSTVNVNGNSAVYGTCTPGSTPANACGGSLTASCPAGYSSGITGNYFNNINLAEPATATRVDAPIDFNWGTAAPGPTGIGVDNFSVRWSGFVRVTQSGIYRFQTVSDDGIRLYVNGNQVISRWNDHSSTTDTTADITLTAGQVVSIMMEYYERGGSAEVRLRWLRPGTTTYVAIPTGPLPTLGAGLYECKSIYTPPVRSCPTSLAAGITGEYFTNTSLTGQPTNTRLDGPINFDWGTGVPGPTGIPAEGFSVRWNGYLQVTQTGAYRFQTDSDDGVRLYVNDEAVINEWNDHSVTTHTSGVVNLMAGSVYPIRLEFYENSGFAVIQLRWQLPGSSAFVTIPKGTTPVSGAGLYGCITRPAGYSFSHSGSGVTCAGEQITVTALDSSGNPFAPVSGTKVTLGTTPTTGVWLGGNEFTFDGSQTSFVKILQQTTPGTLTLNANDGSATGTSSITFADTAIKFYGSAPFNSTIPTQISGMAGSSILRAIRTNPETGACAAQVIGTRAVDLAYTCRNPVSCISGQTMKLAGVNVASNNDNATSLSYQPANLTFDSQGIANVSIEYSDAGEVQLYARLSLLASGNNPAITLTGGSEKFVVKPHNLFVSAVTDASNKVNPKTTTSGVGFIAAGEPFKVTVQARNYYGNPTPNFGQEKTSQANDLVLNVKDLIHPTGGVKPELVAQGSFVAASSTPSGAYVNSAIKWNEVGSITIAPKLSDADYIGGGDIPNLITSETIGRFYPHHFRINAASSTYTNTCSSFTYMDQPGIKIKPNIIAEALGGERTLNYDNKTLVSPKVYYEADGAGGTPKMARPVYAVENNANNTNLQDRLDVTVGRWDTGVYSEDLTAKFSRNKLTPHIPDGPFSSARIGVSAMTVPTGSYADPTGAVSNSPKDMLSNTAILFSSSPLNILYGRLRLDDAFGSSSMNLPVTFITEFWNGTIFTNNLLDGCTTIARSAITYPKGTIATDANRSVTVTTDGIVTGTSIGTYNSMSTTDIGFSAGDAKHFFTAPTNGATGTFEVRVNLTNYPWLQFNWNQSSTLNDDTMLPVARFGFGQYRGHDRVIYWREQF
ncbi:MAG: DUF6701 domain-containing protein [Cellvibrio sp.]|uniref:DUF6701 domain-containing protein n=1 Tax=Cellvibrio sp. TaxID=1965322 RepID=UPI0031A62FB3